MTESFKCRLCGSRYYSYILSDSPALGHKCEGCGVTFSDPNKFSKVRELYIKYLDNYNIED